MYYLILALTLLAFLGAILLVHYKFPKKQTLIIERIMVFVLMVVFALRFMSYHDVQFDSDNFETFAHFGGPMNGFLNTIGNLCLWLEITAALMVFLRPWSHFKTASFYAKFVALPILFVSAIALYPTIMMAQGDNHLSLMTIMLPIEVGGLLALSIFYLAKDYNLKLSKHSYGEVAVFAVLINLFTMPCFIPNFLFGTGGLGRTVIDFSIIHRIFLYSACIVIPLGVYFCLRNAHQDKIHYSLVMISLGTMLSYFVGFKYDSLLAPWDWPLHLCNLAMILIPICFIFKTKRLFYFTYFINVFGAVLAMLMPDYRETMLVFNPKVWYFWINHCCAYMMPLLGVALYEFERPKLKQFGFSSIWFFIYFVLVLTLNTVFTGLAGTQTPFGVIRETDYFFINSTFIAEKLGKWAENIFNNLVFSFELNGKTMTVHPVYQLIYYSAYALLGFGIWFIYQLMFDVSDSHKALHYRLRGIRIDKLALKSALNGRSLDKPMDENVGISLELKNFSKKYGLNSYYSAKNVNLSVKGGEVFGFLGPNGAGKSTCIKSIVGIQPISEGSISVCGYDVKTQGVGAKSQIGFVPDHYALYENLTGREYLNYIADIYEVSKADRDERLGRYIERFELKDSIDNKIKTYSHGMKQKVTIIAALVHDPKVWILDEPLTGLDPTSIYQVKECMREHASKGNIVFFSSHLIDIVEKLCDRIAIIKHGEIQAELSIKDIESSGRSLEEFYLATIGDNTTKVEK